MWLEPWMVALLLAFIAGALVAAAIYIALCARDKNGEG